ncbi:poly(3-hydroxybutyrate) depolymerase-like [Saccostrea echinata]|uniref:poly(3-hydroxybutyrate) depolymerase-like n=1 Tax=Saccostrea echinata TaxID=191078 RepID=UPI002A820D01|nr:poly(3-hydroxybutyrate) depolymerase-like [Saccostrea echinata]
MASQLHVIYSSRIMGVGIVAGVPFACSGGTLAGLATCMKTPSLESVYTFEALVSSGALFGNVDATYHMRHDKVFIFNGIEDSVVHPGNGPNIARFYEHFIHDSHNIKKVFNMHTEHCMPTDKIGGPCTVLSKTNFLNNCGYNGAFEILNFIYGGHLRRPSQNTTAAGELRKFDQAAFFAAPPITYSLDNTGYIYIPSRCLDKSHSQLSYITLHNYST